MDDCMFRAEMADCKCVPEATSYLEILTYSHPSYNTSEEHKFRPEELPDEFRNFLHRRGTFAPPELRDGVNLIGAVRLILQLNAMDPETFTPSHISLPHQLYEEMVRAMRLPFCAIEATSVVGPFFWAAIDQDDVDPHLQIIFRKSDVRKRGRTRGWELTLSHSFRTNITTGYAKGTPSSDMVESIKRLRACATQTLHPLLLPIIILGSNVSSKTEQRHRTARDLLRNLEMVISLRDLVTYERNHIRNSILDVDQINRDLVECHAQVLWVRPQAYIEVIKRIHRAMDRFWGHVCNNPAYGGAGGEVHKLHRGLLARLEFYTARLTGIENYAHATIERLANQRMALANIIAQKDSKLGLQMAGVQHRLAHTAGREGTSMISLFGAIFLPATYLASIFSMSFFDFTPNGDIDNSTSTSGGGGNDSRSSFVSPLLWIYFAITGPLTLLLVVWWRWWDRRRRIRYAEEDADIEDEIETMEMRILKSMTEKRLEKEAGRKLRET